MIKVGITGGIGCGKSTVAAEFGRRGIACFVADTVAGAYYSDRDFLSSVRSLLGDGVFLPDGTADKRAIAARVFTDKGMLSRLNALVHPRVMADFDRFCQQHDSDSYVLFESAILFDYGFDRMMDRTICVYLSLEERISRLMKRDGGDEIAIRARMVNQMPAEEMMMRADYVILNYEGNPRQRQVEYIDRCLRR